MITAIVIPDDQSEPIRLEQLDEHDLDSYQRLVGGSIEIINLERPASTLYLNDEGKLLGLPLNQRATALLWTHNSAFRGQDVIMGPAFIVGPPDEEGHDEDVPPELVELLLETKRYCVQVQTHDDHRWHGNELVFTDWFEAYAYGGKLAQRWSLVEEVRVIPELDDELREAWYALGLANPWIKEADDPAFTRSSFTGCFSVDELQERIVASTWAIGTAFYYRNLCFIQQVDGGDEWLTIRHGLAFESISLLPFIERDELASLVQRLLAASKEQCRRLEY
jgi:hypothetical protein